MNHNEIRQKFIEFFAERGHRHMASSSLVPHNDPTVLLTTAGMQQMTPYFLGLEAAPSTRMTSIQKCFRTVDIDEVGDESHLTFFEMLGNFSVGDYFKDEAINWAWELVTENFRIPVERLYVTVHHDDTYSYEYWKTAIGLPESKITSLGDEDNWWGPVGDTGPNGPDSEIFYDRGEQYGCGREACGPGCDCGRFLEFWNLVFMEFFKEADGSQRPLPSKNIDTGMGMERIALILQGTETVFETDLYLPIIEHVSTLTGVRYGESERTDQSLRVIADHGRSVTFLILDGVFPGNEGRSYVLRRVLRRAVRHGRLLGLESAFLSSVSEKVAELFKDHYPDLPRELSRIKRIIDHEEAHFSATLETGIARFDQLIVDLEKTGETVIPGKEAFRLYDTFGFPVELTEELAADRGLTVDRATFIDAMDAQRATSRVRKAGATAGDDPVLASSITGRDLPETRFVGYELDRTDAEILHVARQGQSEPRLEAGDEGIVVLRETPFYAESGGQVGDTGVITSETGVFEVEDTQRTAAGVIVHIGQVREGFIETGTIASASIDNDRRQRIRRNHTATHLLHAALRATLGDHAQQAGSLVAPDRLRFDFTNLEPVGSERLEAIQEAVSRQVLKDSAVMSEVTDYRDAIERGAIALFGEKYGDDVRVISIDKYSRELCGGTHVGRTGEIGPFIITEESSVASGVRRIEAITGEAAIHQTSRLQQTVQELERVLHAPSNQLIEQARSNAERIRTLERQIEQLRVEMATSQVEGIIGTQQDVDGVPVLAARVDAANRDVLLQLADRCRDRVGSAVIVLVAPLDDRPALLATVSNDLVERGLHAGKLIGHLAPIVGGRGGGRPNMAQGAGNDIGNIDRVVSSVPDAVRIQLSDQAQA